MRPRDDDLVHLLTNKVSACVEAIKNSLHYDTIPKYTKEIKHYIETLEIYADGHD